MIKKLNEFNLESRNNISFWYSVKTWPFQDSPEAADQAWFDSDIQRYLIYSLGDRIFPLKLPILYSKG